MTDAEALRLGCKAVVRYGVPGEWHYLVMNDEYGPVFSNEQSAAFRFDSFDDARASIRSVVSNCEDPDVARTIRPVRLFGTKFVNTGGE